MSDEYLTIGSHQNEILPPNDETDLIEMLIDQFINLADPLKLLNPEKILVLEEIKRKYSNQKLELIEKINQIFSKVKCKDCQNPYKGKHSCGHLICASCIKSNNYICNHCNKQLSHEMIRKYCKKSLSCINCREAVSSRCGHYCESCILLNSKDFYNSCESCLEYYEEQALKSASCLKCKQNSVVFKMFEFCKKHFLCETCSTEQVQSGKCYCGLTLSIVKIKFIYDKTFEFCSNCKYCFRKNEMNQLESSENFFCSICINFHSENDDYDF